jgi:mannose-6-phosphate isomerase-like protein (cupin superfamily)
MLYVESGKIKVTSWKTDYDLVDKTIISAGECTTSPPNEYHMFESLEDSVVYEIYWVSLNEYDIVRENHGGLN